MSLLDPAALWHQKGKVPLPPPLLLTTQCLAPHPTDPLWTHSTQPNPTCILPTNPPTLLARLPRKNQRATKRGGRVWNHTSTSEISFRQQQVVEMIQQSCLTLRWRGKKALADRRQRLLHTDLHLAFLPEVTIPTGDSAEANACQRFSGMLS